MRKGLVVIRQLIAMCARLVARLGHLALWLGLYFVAVYALAALLLGRHLRMPALIGSFAAGMAIYLLDRLKLSDAALDPADLLANEPRHVFLRQRASLYRMLAWVFVAIGTVAVVAMHPINLILPVVGVGGVLLYSHAKTEPGEQGGADDASARVRLRLKDRLMLKNLLPGGAIAGFGTMLALQSQGNALESFAVGDVFQWPTVLVAFFLTIVITFDASLCDIEDMDADAAHRTATLPIVLGVRQLWVLATVAQVLAASGLLLAFDMMDLPTFTEPVQRSLVLFIITTLVFHSMLALMPQRSIRDLIDLKLPVIVWVLYLSLSGA